MHVEKYETPEERDAFLAERAASAHIGLHIEQARLTYGDHWVRFVDLDKKVVEFAHIPTLEKQAQYMLNQGYTWDVVRDDLHAIETASGSAEQVFSSIHSIEDPLGRDDFVHRAHVWPIEERLWSMATIAEWDISRLDEVGRILLDIAFRAMRAHVVGVRS